jgi:hypothetical protein
MLICFIKNCNYFEIIKLIINLRNITRMRKTTQSMYQSNMKAPMSNSKVFDGSNMFKSSTAIPGI